MPPDRSFTCPACGSEFDVQERLDPSPSELALGGRAVAPAEEASEPVSFQCPGCGADYETREELEPEVAGSGSIR
jgi:predicted RNA-binding Zn-ribbon protein involved in translation (DUF1610 family)